MYGDIKKLQTRDHFIITNFDLFFIFEIDAYCIFPIELI